MSSLINPDVDRISLDRRISALEDKFGTGGSGPGPAPSPGPGGGGVFPGGGGGGSWPVGGSSVITGAIDFDQYPDNTWSVDENFLIYKWSINDSTPGYAFPAGIDVRLCLAFPTLYQFVIPGAIPISGCARVKLSNLIPFTSFKTSVFRHQISKQNIIDYLNGDANLSLFNVFGMVFDITGSEDCLSYNPIYGIDNKFTMKIDLTNNSLLLNVPTQGASQGCHYGICTSVSMSNAPSTRVEFFVGGNQGYGCLLNKPNDLPKWFQQFYPKSWSS